MGKKSSGTHKILHSDCCPTSSTALSLISVCGMWQVTAEVKESLQSVELRPYEAFLDDVRDIVKAGQYLWADSAKVRVLQRASAPSCMMP